MICISIQKSGYKNCKKILQNSNAQLAEIRLDGADIPTGEIHQIFSLPYRLIAACRPGGCSEMDRMKLLMASIIAGAAYVDIEIESGPIFKNELIQTARLQGCRVIISYHNFDITPEKNELDRILDQCFIDGADIAKIACKVNSNADAARILSLYDYESGSKNAAETETRKNRPIIAIGMGDKGKITRIAAPLLGAPFTYAYPSNEPETAPGQLDNKTMEHIFGILLRS